MLIALTSCKEAGGSPAVDAGALVVPCPFAVPAGPCLNSTTAATPAAAPSTASTPRAISHRGPRRRRGRTSGWCSGQAPGGAAAPDPDRGPGSGADPGPEPDLGEGSYQEEKSGGGTAEGAGAWYPAYPAADPGPEPPGDPDEDPGAE